MLINSAYRGPLAVRATFSVQDVPKNALSRFLCIQTIWLKTVREKAALDILQNSIFGPKKFNKFLTDSVHDVVAKQEKSSLPSKKSPRGNIIK